MRTLILLVLLALAIPVRAQFVATVQHGPLSAQTTWESGVLPDSNKSCSLGYEHTMGGVITCRSVIKFGGLSAVAGDTLFVHRHMYWDRVEGDESQDLVLVFRGSDDALFSFSEGAPSIGEVIIDKPMGALLTLESETIRHLFSAQRLTVQSPLALNDKIVRAQEMTIGPNGKIEGNGGIIYGIYHEPGTYQSLLGRVEFAIATQHDVVVQLVFSDAILNVAEKNSTLNLLPGMFDINTMVPGKYRFDLPAEIYQDDGNGALILAEQTQETDGSVSVNLHEGQNQFFVNLITSNTASEDEGLPAEFVLHPAYPNPFNPSTTIAVELAQTGVVTLVVYDALGRKVKTLEDRLMAAGRHEVHFDAAGLPSGTYLVTAIGERTRAHTKVVLMK